MAETRQASRLRIITLFEDLDDAALERVSEACTTRPYERHSQILSEQDLTDDVFFILEGTVRITSLTPAGREIIFTDVSAGNMFGEFAAIDGLPRSATVTALTDCVLARMSATS